MSATNDPSVLKEIAIPAETVKLLLAGVLNELGGIAETVEQLSESREESEINKLPATFERLDDFRLLREKAQRSIELLQAALDDVISHESDTEEAQQE